MSIHLDLFIKWRDLADHRLNLNLLNENQQELVITEPAFVYLIEKFMDQGDLEFNDRENFIAHLEEISSHLNELEPLNQQYLSKLYELGLGIRKRLRF